MAPRPATLKHVIEQELTSLEARATELRIALKVVREFGADDTELARTTGERKSVIIKPGDEVPEAVKSRLAEGASQAADVADKALELDRS